ncbi:MAG: lipocalin-like domain-containing protein [Thermoanaerobaculia bacterium]
MFLRNGGPLAAQAGRRAPSRLPAALLAVAVAVAGACDHREDAPAATARGSLTVAEALEGEGAAGYARALEPRPFAFPEDHGPHPEFRTEWWYLTGNLETSEGRRFGYQLTFFRNALAPPPPAGPDPSRRASPWATRQAWLAHFAVTDAAGKTFHSGDRLARGAVGLAGAELVAGAPGGGSGELRVWVEDWSAEPAPNERAPEASWTEAPAPDAPGAAPSGTTAGAPNAPGPDDPAVLGTLRLRAGVDGKEGGGAAVDLRVRPLRPPILNGDAGLSHKGGEAGNASYYYSIPRLATEGTVRIGGREHGVRGLSWMDREWSTSALGPDQVGWDWFSLQLGDGRDLMLYRLRRRDGTVDPASSGTLVERNGEVRHLDAEDARVEVLDRWESPRSGALYPAGWRIRVSGAGLGLTVAPVLADQELDLAALGFRYWEGAVDVEGTSGGRPVAGRGYVELTGYE